MAKSSVPFGVISSIPISKKNSFSIIGIAHILNWTLRSWYGGAHGRRNGLGQAEDPRSANVAKCPFTFFSRLHTS